MAAAISLTDPTAAPAYQDSAINRWLASHLYEARDVVFLRLTIKVLLILPAMMVALYWRFSWPLALAFWVVQLAWLSPSVILMLHNTMHRPFFKRKSWLTRAHAYVMSALFGIPTGYFEHHVGMHHVENNLPPDLSTTMKYQRDNFFHFLRYFTRFMLIGIIELPIYLFKKRRHFLMRRALISTFAHWGLMLTGLYFAFWPTLVCFVVPWFTLHFLMMWGNWGQHAFIDATQPGNSYVNSITCINSGYNARAWNDGYHIGHHVKANRHWTEMPQDFLDNRERYAKEGRDRVCRGRLLHRVAAAVHPAVRHAGETFRAPRRPVRL